MKTAGRIRDDDLEQVRRRADLIEVAGEYMQLKKAGKLFKALCPFHQEKTPSFSLDPAKGLYYCHGCSEGGDVITLVSKLESLSFVETIERLAQRAGVDLRYEQVSPAERSAHRRRLRLVEAHRAAIGFYFQTLLTSQEAADARTYLKGRGFGKEIAERFQIGFAPGVWDALVKHLRAAKFADQELLDAGLASRTQDGRLVDRFRGRVMFPIFDVTGDPVAFGARRMGEGNDGPKYLNSAESPIYQKGHVLYGLNWAKSAIVKNARALVVEGYTDVIALQEAGIEEAVATCGTALGLEHLRGLQRFTQSLVLSLDADEAGGKAAERMYDQLIGEAQSLGMSVRVVIMPQGDDPADSVARLGAEGFGALVEQAVPLLGFVLQREVTRYNVGDPDSQSRALAAAVRLIAKTEKRNERDEYIRRLSGWIKVDPQILHYEVDKMVTTGASPQAISKETIRRSSTQVRLEKEALKIALQHPVEVKAYVPDIGPSLFSVPVHRTLWEHVVEGRDLAGVSLDDVAKRAYTELSVRPVDGDARDQRLVASIFGRLKEFVLSRQIDELKTRLQAINPIDDPDGHTALFTELIELERSKRMLTEEGGAWG